MNSQGWGLRGRGTSSGGLPDTSCPTRLWHDLHRWPRQSGRSRPPKEFHRVLLVDSEADVQTPYKERSKILNRDGYLTSLILNIQGWCCIFKLLKVNQVWHLTEKSILDIWANGALLINFITILSNKRKNSFFSIQSKIGKLIYRYSLFKI